VQSGRIDPKKLISHRFAIADALKAYDAFANAAKEKALKVILTAG
jgi:alcohol dehydrogenase